LELLCNKNTKAKINDKKVATLKGQSIELSLNRVGGK
jgi:hypothetical protein